MRRVSGFEVIRDIFEVFEEAMYVCRIRNLDGDYYLLPRGVCSFVLLLVVDDGYLNWYGRRIKYSKTNLGIVRSQVILDSSKSSEDFIWGFFDRYAEPKFRQVSPGQYASEIFHDYTAKVFRGSYGWAPYSSYGKARRHSPSKRLSEALLNAYAMVTTRPEDPIPDSDEILRLYRRDGSNQDIYYYPSRTCPTQDDLTLGEFFREHPV